MEMDEEIREFLIESNENLANLDREIVQLEQSPGDVKLISSVFRTIHTIKGTCGFFGYDILGSVTHIAENILSQVRERQRDFTPELISLILETVDEVKVLLGRIEATGAEGEDQTGPLRARLEQAYQSTRDPVHLEVIEVIKEENKVEEQASHIVPEPVSATPDPTFAAMPALPPAADLAFQESDAGASTTEETTPVTGTFDYLVKSPHAEVPSFQPENGELDEEAQVPAAASTPLSVAKESDPVVARAVPVIATRNYPKDADDNRSSNPDKEIAKDTIKDAQLMDSTIRVDVGLLNRLMNLVGELVLARNQLLQDTSSLNPSLQKTSQRLNLITSELQEGVMKTRMQPIGVVWNKLPRVVRDLAAACGKRIQIEMDGAGTELDKTIIEAIKDPLTHIVRNSCDHGIETPEVRIAKNKNPEGTLLLRAYHEGGVVNIEISDDGAGIDAEKVKSKAVEKGLLLPAQAAQMSARDALHLIFMPGFSTAAQITSISGRGVGMDVVKTNIEKIGGSVDVLPRAEGGTTIRIKIPLTLAIIPGLVVTLNHEDDQAQSTKGPEWNKEERFIIPQANLLELVHVEGAEEMKRIENVHGTAVFHHRGKLLPLVYLGRILGRADSGRSDEAVNIIVLQAENRQMGLVVDRICDTQEIVVKPLGRQLKGLSSYVGATIMGDGRPALILDVAGLSRLAGLGTQTRQVTQIGPSEAVGAAQPQMMLLFRVGRFDRLAVPLSRVGRLEEISTASIERSGGRSVLYYRGDILPLITLGSVLDPGALDETLSRETVQVVVFTDGSRRVGLIVDQIVDIVNEAITVRRSTTVPGLLGSAVLGGKITDLIDLHALVQSSGENWLDPSIDTSDNRHKVLLLDASVVAREMITEFLDVSGFEVIQASSVSEALSKITQVTVDLVITAIELPVGEGRELLQALRRDDSRSGSSDRIPIVGLLDRAGQKGLTNAGEWIFDAQVVRSEREALLRSVSALMHEHAEVTR